MKARTLFLLMNLLCIAASAQVKPIKEAISLFEKGDYTTVIEQLENIISTNTANERDPKTNYYLGASYVAANRNVSEGIRRLKFAQVKKFVANSNYYLGCGYQMNYEFEQAISTFDKFLKTARDQELIDDSQARILQCQNAIPLASKIFALRVIDKYKVTPDSLLAVYNPSKEVGTIQRNKDFFESDVDPEGVLYRTERGDEVFFSLSNGNGVEKLYKIERLLDGWGEMVALDGLASEGNDKMAVMMTDGTTLYFTSDRAGGMGGLDIYSSTYDPETRKFSEPVNLGVPFNSQADDYLFVADEFRKRAWFASTRETTADSVMVYEILWDDSVIRNFAQNTEEIRQAAALKIDPSLQHMRDDITRLGIRKGNKSVTSSADKFRFVVNDSLTYTQWEHFRSQEAVAKYREALAVQAKNDSLTNVMGELRKDFMRIESETRRNEIVGEVMKVERVVYNLEDQLKDLYDNVRSIENAYISELVANGQYASLSTVKALLGSTFDWEKVLNPELYSMYSTVPFDEVRRENEEMYKVLFAPEDIAELQLADSLCAWAGILALQAQTNSTTPEESRPVYDFDIAKASAVLYFNNLDKKYDIFEDRYANAMEVETAYNMTEVTVQKRRAESAFHAVGEATVQDDVETLARVNTVKKQGIVDFNEGLLRYAAHVDGTFPLPAAGETPTVAYAPLPTATNVQTEEIITIKEDSKVATIGQQVEIEEPQPPLEPEPVKSEAQAAAATVGSEVGDATVSPYGAGKPVYRIQLGVFKNQPDLAKLSTYGVLTKQYLADRGLTKYFAGSYAKYAEALAAQEQTKQAFAGAFIVAFVDGEQVKLGVAQSKE